jgi:flagellar hook-associated protein 3 FlgL
MDLRVTLQTMVNQAIDNTQAETDRLGQLQEQMATGSRLLVASDNPVDMATLLASQAQDQRYTTYLGNIQDSTTLLNSQVSALRQAGDVLSQARQIAVQASSSVNDPSSLETLAEQVDGLINQLLDAANTTANGKYLFSGTATGTAPYAVTSRDAQGRPLTITYQGGANAAQEAVSQQQDVTTYLPGSGLFQSSQRQPTVYSGPTGAAAGTGTDSAVGQGTLLVSHTATTYAAGSGVKPGTGSAAGDTILGPAGAHTLTIVDTSGTGAAGTVSLDGGAPIAFSSSDSNLMVTGPGGQVVYLDTTAITPGFSGTVAITADGTLSTDGGATTVPIAFSANQVVTNSATGAVTNVNSTQIRQTGTDGLTYPGTEDAFQVLMSLRDALRNTSGLSANDQVQAISGTIAELDRVHNGVLAGVGEQSVSLQNLGNLQTHLQDLQLNSQKLVTDLQGLDVPTAVVQLQEQENLLQMSLAATARIFSTSLLDFLH